MSLLSRLKTDDTIANETDSLGGGGGAKESGAYLATINKAFLDTSAGGAVSLEIHATMEDGSPFKTTLWLTSSTAKGGNNYYLDKSGNKKYLPGFLHANAIAQLLAGKDISDLDPETKTVSLWSFEASAEVPTKVEMLMELLGKQIYLGLIKQTVNKNVKDATGKYVPTAETRDENELDKVFHGESKMTLTEIKASATEPAFFDAWVAKNAGKTRNRVKPAGATGAAPSTARTGGATTASKPATSSLFD